MFRRHVRREASPHVPGWGEVRHNERLVVLGALTRDSPYAHLGAAFPHRCGEVTDDPGVGTLRAGEVEIVDLAVPVGGRAGRRSRRPRGGGGLPGRILAVLLAVETVVADLPGRGHLRRPRLRIFHQLRVESERRRPVLRPVTVDLTQRFLEKCRVRLVRKRFAHDFSTFAEELFRAPATSCHGSITRGKCAFHNASHRDGWPA
ncbi:Protein of unknown function [Micromonospora lupini str. Lupac 08]|uniref:Uncharacterized protein n=1 Tax=Micromonospora lupini str. Lupac 08 TaxID=1150864 RepID=I0KWQ8_9ACTN|nr:Protein of unknown function [Micromonospora lupini str. Lupac 08]